MDIGVARGEIQIETGQAISSIQGLSSALRAADSMGAGSMQATGMQIQQVGLAYQQAGRVMLGAGAAMALPFIGATKAAIGFESQMAGVNSVMDITDEQFQQLSDMASQLGQDSIYSGEQAAQGIETLGKAGLGAEDILGGAAEGVVNLAAAAGTSTTAAAEIMAAALTQFELAGDQAPHVADVIAGAANSSLLSLNDMGIGLAQVGGIANAANMSFEETAAFMAIMGDMGLSGSDGATSLKTAILALLAPTDKAAGFMQDWGIEILDTAGNFKGLEGASREFFEAWQTSGQTMEEFMSPMTKIMGRDAVRAIIAGMQAIENENKEGVKGWDDYVNAVNDADAAQRIAEDRMDSTAGAIEKLRGSLSVLGERVGAPILTVLRPMIEGLDRVVDAFANLPEPVLAAVAALGTMAATFTLVGGAALFAGGHIIEAVGRLASVGISIPAIIGRVGAMVPVILGVTAAITALAIAWQNDFLGVRTATEEFLGGLADTFNEARTAAQDMGLDGVADDIYAVGVAASSLGLDGLADFFIRGAQAIDTFLDKRQELVDEIEDDRPDSNYGDMLVNEEDVVASKETLTFLDNLTTNLDAAAHAMDLTLGSGNDISKFLRGASKGAKDFAERWDSIANMGYSGITGATLALGDFFTAIGAEGIGTALGNLGNLLFNMESQIKVFTDAGMNPFSASLAAAGIAIENLTGLPVAQTFVDWANAIELGVAAAENLATAGLNPVASLLGGIGATLDSLGFEGLANSLRTAAVGAQTFGDVFEQATASGLNPFHAAALAALNAIEAMTGGASGLTTALRNIIGGVQNFASEVIPTMQRFGDTWSRVNDEMLAMGEGPIQSALAATTVAIGELFGQDWSGQAQGIVDFANTVASAANAISQGDWSGAAAEINSAIDQIVGAVQDVNIPQVLVNIGGWALGTIGQTIDEFLTGLFGGGQGSDYDAQGNFGGGGFGPGMGAGVTVRGVLVNVADWAKGEIEELGPKVKEWADTAAASVKGAVETTVGNVKAAVEGWDIINRAGDLLSELRAWALGESGGGLQGGMIDPAGVSGTAGALEIGVGSIGAVVEGFLVRLGDGAENLASAVSTWIQEQTGGSGADYDAQGNFGAGGMAIPIGEIAAEIQGWALSSLQALGTAIAEWIERDSGVIGQILPIGRISAEIQGWEITSIQDIGTAVKEWIAGQGVNSMGGPGERGEPGTGGGIPIGEILLQIGTIAWETAQTADQIGGDLINFVLDKIAEITMGDAAEAAGASELGKQIGTEIGTAIFGSLADGMNSGDAVAAADAAGRAAGSQSHSLVRAFLGAFFEGLNSAFTQQITGFDVDLKELLPGGDPSQLFKIRNPDAPVYAWIDSLGENNEHHNALLGQGISDYFNNLGADGVSIESPYIQTDGTFNIDAINADWQMVTPEAPTVEGNFPVNVDTSGQVWVYSDMAGNEMNLAPGVYDALADGLSTDGNVAITPDGIIVSRATGTPIMFEEDAEGRLIISADTPITIDPAAGIEVDPAVAGQPIIMDQPMRLQGEIFVDAAGNEVALSPETAAFIREDALKEGGIFQVQPDGIVMRLDPETGEFSVPITPDMLDIPISEQLEGMTFPQSEQALATPIQDTVKNAMDAAGKVGAGDVSSSALLVGLDNLLSGSVPTDAKSGLPNFLANATTLIQSGISAIGDAISGAEAGKDAAGGGANIGQDIMTNLASEVTTADVTPVSTAMQTKMNEAITAGMTLGGGTAAKGSDAGAAGIGTTIATSLASQITGADFTTVGTAINAKIGEALTLGLSQAGGQAGGAAGEGGGGIGASVVTSLTSGLEGADFGPLGETINTKITEAITSVSGEGAEVNLDPMIQSIIQSGVEAASQATQIGEAIATHAGSGAASSQALNGATTTLVSAAISTGVGATSGATEIGTMLDTHAGSGAASGQAFSGGVTSMVTAAIATGVSASSAATEIGTMTATHAGAGAASAQEFNGAVTTMVTAGISAGVGAAGGATAIGAAVSAGAAAGIDVNALVGPAVTMVNNAIAAAMSAAGAASPSKVFMEIGGWLSEGAAIGVEEKSGLVKDSVRDMVRAAIDEAEGLREIGTKMGDNTREVNQDLQGITEIAAILENAPGWNEFGGILRSSAEGIKDSTRAMREDVQDLVRGIREQLKDMASELARTSEQVGEEIGQGIASGTAGAGGGVGGSIEDTLNKELAGIDIDEFVIDRDMFKSARQGIGELRGVGGELRRIEEIATILDNAPGWNNFGDVLREAVGNVEDHVGGARDKFQEITKSMGEITRTQTKAITEAIRKLVEEVKSAFADMGTGAAEGVQRGTEGATGGATESAGNLVDKWSNVLNTGMDNAGTQAGNQAEQITNGQIPGGLNAGAPAMNETATGIGEDMGTSLEEGMTTGSAGAVPAATEAGDAVGGAFNTGAASNIPDARALGAQISNSVLEALQASAIGDTEAVRLIGEAFGNAFGQGITSATPEATQAGVALTDATETGMRNGLPSAQNTAGNVGENIGEGMEQGLNSTAGEVQGAGRDLGAEAAADGMAAGERIGSREADRAGEEIGSSLATGLRQSMPDVSQQARTMGTTTVDSINSAIKSKAASMRAEITAMIDGSVVDPTADAKPVGVDFIGGMISGLNSESSTLYDKVIQIVNQAIAEAERTADNGSPSKRMMVWGNDVGDGMVVGLEQKRDPVIDTMRSITEEMIGAASVGEIQAGTFAFNAIGDNLKWSANQLNEMLDRSTDRRLRLMETFSANGKGREAAKSSSTTTPIQIGDIVLQEGQAGYNEARGFIDAIATNHPAYYGTKRK